MYKTTPLARILLVNGATAVLVIVSMILSKVGVTEWGGDTNSIARHKNRKTAKTLSTRSDASPLRITVVYYGCAKFPSLLRSSL